MSDASDNLFDQWDAVRHAIDRLLTAQLHDMTEAAASLEAAKGNMQNAIRQFSLGLREGKSHE